VLRGWGEDAAKDEWSTCAYRSLSLRSELGGVYRVTSHAHNQLAHYMYVYPISRGHQEVDYRALETIPGRVRDDETNSDQRPRTRSSVPSKVKSRRIPSQRSYPLQQAYLRM